MKKSRLMGAMRICVLFIGSSLCMSANAATIRADVTFNANNFTDLFSTGATPPQSSVSGSFAFLFDDTVSFSADFAPVEINLTINGFSYSIANTTIDISVFGGALQGLTFGATTDSINSNNQVEQGINDFALSLTPASNTFNSFLYADPSVSDDIFKSTSGTITSGLKITR